MAIADLDTINAMELGMSPNDYKLMRQKKDQMDLAQNTPSVPWLPDSVPTQAEINAQTMSADQAPSADQSPPMPQAPAQNLAMPPEDISAQPPAPQELTAPDFSGQQQGIADLKAGLQKYLAQNNQVDLSPLAALADAQTGSHLAQSYSKPTTPEEKAVMAEKLRNMVQEAQTGLSKEQVSYINAKTAQENKKISQQQLLEQKKQTDALNHANKMSDKQEKNAIELGKEAEHFRGNSAVQGANENLVYAKNALNLLDEAPNGDLNQVPGLDVGLFYEELGKLAKGGTSTEGTRHAIEASTLKSNFEKTFGSVVGTPQPAQLGAFLIRNKKYLEALQGNYQQVVNKYRKNMFDTYEPSLSDTQAERFKARYPEVFAPKAKSAAPPINNSGSSGLSSGQGSGGLTPEQQKRLDELNAKAGQ
jgi:hypothetical protein